MDIGIPDDRIRRGLVDYLMEFDTDLAPVVGQHVIPSEASSPVLGPRRGHGIAHRGGGHGHE